ncbi:stage II sporulation protein M [Clostridium pasteurianum DSM 525 = ATCC 6013]|uniref:Stage II sporulation protein M n=1 Tax=Clostridium pasteurianum DSM 525 = ATCC 6013 TaxID=1262449 RepID=A0A0H3J3E7_CLOPA|nr:stage II sporulation protein M [Clostridium pasteurianum]AJA47994.1 stage II sporulation protein M [Clostridium pasteurianum DSM 525 = ATCC 6013]AJA51982.1 stage II sporulation protein M [Clostridium pasteurianum DSM 525 = ATCC 6013]AOZ75279.1 sporulation protein [Clostridium pasteurianum DSM 525 = ATCC 6013]AOZ79074.1 sporulation protein [Clostridium pasteurianum]ELP59897.1 sporulation protein [Clostridium pasteurianum DSM 525 = ATCC 6013]
MKVTFFKNLIASHLQNNLWLYVLSAICLCTGIVLGVYTVKYMSGFEKSDLLNYLSSFMKNYNSQTINYNQLFLETAKNNIPILLIVWFLGLTMIGIPIILVLDVIKGFTMGFTVTFFVNGMGFKGIWMALLSVIPQNIIYIPCIIIGSVVAMEFSLMLIKSNGKKHWTTGISSRIMSYSIVFIIIAACMFVGLSFETYITPNIIKAIA